MKEIEIKIQISPEQREQLQKWLDKNAEFTGEKQHVEYYLDNPENSLRFEHKLGYIDASHYLRVRTTEKGDSICLKIFDINLEDGSSSSAR